MSKYNKKSQNHLLSVDNLYLNGLSTKIERPGIIRFNDQNNNFEGYVAQNDKHKDTNNGWQTLGMNKAQKYIDCNNNINPNARIGGVKIGHNLSLSNEGVLSSFNKGISLIDHNVIIVANFNTKNISDYCDNNISADFFSINSALHEINSRISDIYDKSISKQDFRLKNSYLIKLCPGVYIEKINFNLEFLKYVNISIIGESKNNCIVKLPQNNNNIIYSNIENLYLSNITFDFTIGIDSNVLEKTFKCLILENNTELDNINLNVTLNNIIENQNNIAIKIKDAYKVLINKVSINVLDNFLEKSVDSFNNICLDVENISNLYISNTQFDISNNAISFNRGNHYGISIINSKLNMNNSNINLLGNQDTYGIFNFHSYLNIDNTKITAIGKYSSGIEFYDNFSSKNELFAIDENFYPLMHDNLVNIELENSSLVFQNNEEQNLYDFDIGNIIKIVNQDYSYADFLEIRNLNLTNNNIKLEHNKIISKQKISGYVQKWFNSNINNVTIVSNVNSLTIGNFYYVQVNNLLNCINDVLIHPKIFNYSTGYLSSKKNNIINVGLNHNFKSINQALLSIENNSIYNMYTLKLSPGIYYESNINCLPYVNIVGDHKSNTIIVFKSNNLGKNLLNNDDDLADNSFIKLTHNSGIKNVKFIIDKYNVPLENSCFSMIYYNPMLKENIDNEYLLSPYLDSIEIIMNKSANINIGIILDLHLTKEQQLIYDEQMMDKYNKLCQVKFDNLLINIAGANNNIGMLIENGNTSRNNYRYSDKNIDIGNILNNSQIIVNCEKKENHIVNEYLNHNYANNTSINTNMLISNVTLILKFVNFKINLDYASIIMNNTICKIKNSELNNYNGSFFKYNSAQLININCLFYSNKDNINIDNEHIVYSDCLLNNIKLERNGDIRKQKSLIKIENGFENDLKENEIVFYFENDSNSTGQNLFLAYKDNQNKIFKNQMKFIENKVNKIDYNNVIKFSLKFTSLGTEHFYRFVTKDIINSLIPNDRKYDIDECYRITKWHYIIGSMKKISNIKKDLYQINTKLKNKKNIDYISSWHITNKFFKGLANQNDFDYDSNYKTLIPYLDSEKHQSIVNMNKLAGNNNENSFCYLPQSIILDDKKLIEKSLLISPLIVNDKYPNISWSNISMNKYEIKKFVFNLKDTIFKKSRKIRFDSFNNTLGYIPESWYTTEIDGELYTNKIVKYRIIRFEDIKMLGLEKNNCLEIKIDDLYNTLQSKPWNNLRGKILNRSNIEFIEDNIKQRTYQLDKDSFEEFCGADSNNGDKGTGWITYESSIPKCLGFQIAFGVDTNENVDLSNDDILDKNHINGWYIRNIQIFS